MVYETVPTVFSSPKYHQIELTINYMHGLKRTTYSQADLDARRIREQAKLRDFLDLTHTVLSRKKIRDYSADALDLTTRLLHVNPEFYTVWNYRRNIYLHGVFPKRTREEIHALLLGDINITTMLLKAHPKVYWIWNHRRWCLEGIPDGPGPEGGENALAWKKAAWDNELSVVDKMLEADSRNFQAWDYRRYIHATMPVARSELAELAYTKDKIESSLSNFSAWHQRSKVLSLLWANGKLDEATSREQEFEFVRNAMYVDPDDEGLWTYHRWLIGAGDDQTILDREIDVIQELLDMEPDSKWCMESIVHYRLMLLRKHGVKEGVEGCRALLEKLQRVDVCRRKRYEEMGRYLV